MRIGLLLFAVPLLAAAQPRAAPNAPPNDGYDGAADSAAMFEENKLKPDITTMDSGLQYRVLKSGSGEMKPDAPDPCYVFYQGRSLREYKVGGMPFDKFLSGQNLEDKETGQKMVPEQTIAGFREALLSMVVGDKWELFMPASIAYGPRGVKQINIAPNEMLVFELELLKIGGGMDCIVMTGKGCTDREKKYLERWKLQGRHAIRKEHGRLQSQMAFYPHYYKGWLKKKFKLLEKLEQKYIGNMLGYVDMIAPEEMQTKIVDV